jgi:alkanesulfonate monooxygenase SsuD/methylene tetrahydromethanopterin reductase-like flavin-dependent oxidoreductase (luciferase family)
VSARATADVGLLLPMVSTGRSTREFLAEIETEVLLAERSGLSVTLVPEHHHGPAAGLSDALSVTGWLLARTTTMRVGPGVLIAPLHHPVALLERASILQHASGDRLIMGVGAGYQPEDFAMFGKDVARRKADFEAVLRAWRSAADGAADLGAIPALPEAVPPLWVGAWSPSGVRLAARYGDLLLIDPIRSAAEIEHLLTVYRAECERCERPPHTALIRHLWVAETDEAARREFAPTIEPIYRYYHRHGGLGASPGVAAGDLVLGGALDERVVCGAPETVLAQLESLVELTGAGAVIVSLRQPAGPSHEAVCRALSLFADQVAPHLAGALTTSPQDTGRRR